MILLQHAKYHWIPLNHKWEMVSGIKFCKTKQVEIQNAVNFSKFKISKFRQDVHQWRAPINNDFDSIAIESVFWKKWLWLWLIWLAVIVIVIVICLWGNEIDCDCDLIWIFKWFRKIIFKSFQIIFIYFVEYFKNTLIL